MVHLSGLWSLTDETFRALAVPGPRCARTGIAGSTRREGPAEIWRGIEVGVSEAELWRWVAQMYRGAGTYGWPVLESPRHESADYLLESLPHPAAGDSWGEWLELTEAGPGRRLRWRLGDDCSILGFTRSGLSIEYAVMPLGPGCCRLESRVVTTGRSLTGPVAHHLRATVDQILPAFQLPRLRTYAETLPGRLAAGEVGRNRPREHQPPGFTPGSVRGGIPVSGPEPPAEDREHRPA